MSSAHISRRFDPAQYATLRRLGVLGDDGPSDLFLLQQSLANAQDDLADAQAHGSPDDIAQSQAIVDHLAAQVAAGQNDPAAAAQAVADNAAAQRAFKEATDRDPRQTAGKTWLQWFAATPVATGVIRTGAFTSGATGINKTAVDEAITKYDDPRLNAAGARAAGEEAGALFKGIVKAVVIAGAIVGGVIVVRNVKRAKRVVVGP